jgi:hypothetical protein
LVDVYDGLPVDRCELVVKENELEVVLRDGEFVDPSGVYLVLVVVLAVAFFAKVRVLQAMHVGVVSLCFWHEFVELVCRIWWPPK